MNKRLVVPVIICAAIGYLVLLFYISSVQSMYRIEITTEKEIYKFSKEQVEDYIIPVTINNKANRMLSSAGDVCIYVSYHLYDDDGKLLVYDNVRSGFDKAFYTGDVGSIDLHVSPMKEGKYKIGIDVVEEGAEWFSEQEDMEKLIEIIVE